MTIQRAHGRILFSALTLAIGLCGPSALASESADKARAYFEKGELRAATIELKNALQKDPNDADARLLLRIPDETGHRFQVKVDTDSTANWTPVPAQTGH